MAFFTSSRSLTLPRMSAQHCHTGSGWATTALAYADAPLSLNCSQADFLIFVAVFAFTVPSLNCSQAGHRLSLVVFAYSVTCFFTLTSLRPCILFLHLLARCVPPSWS